MATSKQLALRVPGEPLSEIDAFFRQQGLDEWTVKSKGSRKLITGRTSDGTTLRYSTYASDGYSERTSSSCAGLSRAQRQIQAKRLAKQGHTQMEIAERLGCSQKTVSNDLRR
jgi:DNA-directed RNA polymerase specialized sigma24 family protein